MDGKKNFNAVFLAPHDPSVIIHVLCVMFHCSIDNTRKGIGGNEITYFSRALLVLSALRCALLAGNNGSHYKRSCFVGFLRLLSVTTVHLSVCNE